ncbi:MAG: hypothetical protein EPN47_21090 [Acidobacteria bacterium]|nr:MAG: hypothetical protein EPN47_21090 [Acidobacteriota bacterium]
MAPGTEFDEPTVPRPRSRGADSEHSSLGFKTRLIIKRAIFWSYERGSWQYDIICVLILAFIFLTPIRWFHDRPRLQLSDLRHVQGIVEVSHTDRVWVYQLDARLVESLGQIPFNDAVRQLLHQRVTPPFEIKSIKPILGTGDVILGYTVAVER